MRLIGYLLVGLVALAMLRVAIRLMLISAVLAFLWSAIARPREMAAFVFAFAALGLIEQFPAAGLAVFGILGIAGLMNSR